MNKSSRNSIRSSLSAAGTQKGFLSSRQAFVLLGLLFMAPAFVALVMHYSTEEGWRPGGTTNQGNLVHPARPLTFPANMMYGAESLNGFLQGKWTLLYIGAADCADACRSNLYKMRQVRLAQNENMNRVQRLYLVRADTIPAALTGFLEAEHPKMAVVPLSAQQAEQLAPYFLVDDVPMQAAERVYIIDPLGNLMMYYLPGAEPGGMLKDLKKLLKYSKIG